MPLVTRTTQQGNLFRTATEPPNWQNGDLWVDTDDGKVYVNVSGTATELGSGPMELLDTYTASTAENSKTFTFSTALARADYQIIRIVANFEIVAALDFGIQLNGETTNIYFRCSQNNDGTTVTNTRGTAAAFVNVASSALCSNADDSISSTIDIFMTGNATGEMTGNYMSANAVQLEYEIGSIIARTTALTISSITCFTNGGANWKAGGQIMVYGIKATS